MLAVWLSFQLFMVSLKPAKRINKTVDSSNHIYLVLCNGCEYLITKCCLNRGLWAFETYANHLLGHHGGIVLANKHILPESFVN